MGFSRTVGIVAHLTRLATSADRAGHCGLLSDSASEPGPPVESYR